MFGGCLGAEMEVDMGQTESAIDRGWREAVLSGGEGTKHASCGNFNQFYEYTYWFFIDCKARGKMCRILFAFKSCDSNAKKINKPMFWTKLPGTPLRAVWVPHFTSYDLSILSHTLLLIRILSLEWEKTASVTRKIVTKTVDLVILHFFFIFLRNFIFGMSIFGTSLYMILLF